MQQDIRSALTGAAAGLFATLPMTAVMLAGQKLGFVGNAPPSLMASVALGARGEPDPGDLKAKAVAAEIHLAIGGVNGAAYGVLANRTGTPIPAAAQGMLFGIAVWLMGYRGWMPALHIMPPIEKDRPDRQVVLFLAHLAYGATLGLLSRKFRR